MVLELSGQEEGEDYNTMNSAVSTESMDMAEEVRYLNDIVKISK